MVALSAAHPRELPIRDVRLAAAECRPVSLGDVLQAAEDRFDGVRAAGGRWLGGAAGQVVAAPGNARPRVAGEVELAAADRRVAVVDGVVLSAADGAVLE